MEQPIQYQQPEPEPPQMMYTPEMAISNIVGQIDPTTIVDNLDHSLKGEHYNKEKGEWVMNPSGQPLVNDACRGFITSYMTAVLNNNTTMGIITQQQLGLLMESVIQNIGREFVCNLEEFGFVPKGNGYKVKCYENKGTPNSARMDSIADLIYRTCFLCYTRSLNGMESKKIFRSLHMTDGLNFQPPQEQGPGWMGKMFGRR